MAQTVAFQFWILSRHDRADAWTRYLRFVDAGGTKTFRELCEDSGIDVPYEPGCIRRIGSAVSEWISACRL
jgi:oligoendopeptidase F